MSIRSGSKQEIRVMNFIKKYIWEWLVVDTLKGLIKGKLNGNKTSLGLLGVIISAAMSFFPAIPVDSVQPIVDSLPIDSSPISMDEIVGLFSSLLAAWGVVHKVFKFVTGQPQNPSKTK